MSYMEQRENCPNKCGSMTFLKKPIAILLLLPEDVCELSHLEGAETPEHMFGYVLGVCQECGFTLTTTPSHEYNYDTYQWGIRQAVVHQSSEEKEVQS